MVKIFSKYFVILIICFQNLSAQNNIKFDHITLENGLSNSTVTAIYQDKYGFMWFGTQDGLNRYDGYSIKVFRNNSEDSTSLSDNFIFSIYENEEGILYFETQSRKFNEYDPRYESFKLVSKDSLKLNQFRMNSILALNYEGSETIWSGGLSQETGLKKENIVTKDSLVFVNSPNDRSSLSNNKVYSILRDSKGILWVGTADGLNKFDEKNNKFISYKNNIKDEHSLSDNWVWSILEDSKNNLWIGTANGGLNKFNYETQTFQAYKNDPADPKSLNDDYIFSLYQDRSGLIWVGTSAGGVNYFDPSSNVFEHYFNIPNEINSLRDNTVMSLLVDNKGTYWIGTRNGGLDRFDFNQKKFKNYSNNPTNKNSLLSNSILKLFQDSQEILWIGTYSSGLNSFNPNTNKFDSYVNSPNDPNTITDNRIYDILEGDEGLIWIGTYAGGLNSLDKKSGIIENYNVNEDDSTSISSNNVWSLAKDKSGNLWVGTFGGGLNYFDKSTHSFRRFNHKPGDQTSIADDNIIRVFCDSQDRLWVGTTKGLSRYYGDNKFKNYSQKDGLTNDFVFGILEDEDGNLWISTNNGISKFNPETEIFDNYYAEDGLQNNEFNQNAFAKDSKTGNLLFGGINGFNVFNPSNLKGNSYIPQIAFTTYLRFNTDNKEGRPIFEKGIAVRDSLLLSYKDNIIYFEFSALSYYNNLKNQYKYKLQGFNENWIQLQSERDITFTNLSPGKYNLIVLGSNNDGIWNNEGKTLAITVLPPWWKTNYAYAAYLLIILGSLYSIRRVEINRREQKTKVREAELRMKATEAEKRVLQIENDRKTKELDDARQMQLSMLPKEVPEHPEVEIAVFMRTATEVGGDYYDFFIQDDGTLNIAFGDATGHGIQAGTMVTLMKGFFTADAEGLNLQDFMKHCSKLIKSIKLGRILMSFSYLKILDKKLEVSSGGMPPIYYYNFKNEELEEIIIKGMPLGAMASFPYTLYEKDLRSGDTILLITDGIPEQMNDKEEMYDYPRVKEKFAQIVNKSPNEIINILVESCDSWMNGIPQDDDITLMVIKVK